MNLILYVMPAILAFYVIFSVIIYAGSKFNYKKTNNKQLKVSVIISARNEEENIERCLNSLANLQYPDELLEIIIVNDRSEDTTHQLITKFIRNRPVFKYLKIDKIAPHLSGKEGAISEATKVCSGEIIFVTDADCTVPPHWINNMISYFREDVGLVGGFSLVKSSKSLFSKMQVLDWGYLLSIAAGSFGLRIPLSCIGNNFAFRKQAYNEIGGYEGIGFSLTEDFALLRKIVLDTNWKMAFALEPESLVNSKPVPTFREFIQQRKRWAIGGGSVHLFGKVLIATSLLMHFSFIVILFDFSNILRSFLFVAVVLGFDFLIINSALARYNQSKLLKYLPVYKLFFILYAFILLIHLVLDRKIIWKGIKYSSKNVLTNEIGIL